MFVILFGCFLLFTFRLLWLFVCRFEFVICGVGALFWVGINVGDYLLFACVGFRFFWMLVMICLLVGCLLVYLVFRCWLVCKSGC